MAQTTRRTYNPNSPLRVARRKLGHDAYAYLVRQEINLINPGADMGELSHGDRKAVGTRVLQIANDWQPALLEDAS